MKKKMLKTGIALAIVLVTINAGAQTDYGSGYTDPQVIRNTDPISYTVSNPDGNNATFTWTVTGGTIVDQSSPYSATGANSIQVIWDNANKTSVNIGNLTVSKVIDHGDGVSCPGPDQIMEIQSWVSPKATVATSNFHVCSGEASTVDLTFEGKADYSYKWKVYQKDTPANIVEDKTGSFLTSNTSSVTVDIASVVNISGSDIIYVFAVTQVQDAFADIDDGDITTATVEMTVHSTSDIGPIQSGSSLISR